MIRLYLRCWGAIYKQIIRFKHWDRSLCLRSFTFRNSCHLGICKWNHRAWQSEVGKFWYVFTARNKKKEKLQINTYASDYLYVTRFYRSFLAGTTLKMDFSSCCCRGEVSNGYPKTQTRRLYTWKFKIVAQLYSKVPGILIQKAPLKGRTDVFKLYPSFGKTVIIMVCLYLKELYRGCYVSTNAPFHTFASVVWTQEKQWIMELIWARTYVWSTFLNNNSLTFSWVLIYFELFRVSFFF